MNIIGIDPGLVKTGWGVIASQGNALSFIGSGVIKPPTSLSLAERLKFLHDELQKIITLWRPELAAIEETFIGMGGQSALKLGNARGALLLTLSLAGLPVSEYSPNLIKKSVTGAGKAEKTQVSAMVKILLPQAHEQTSVDALDALAVAICHAHHANARSW